MIEIRPRETVILATGFPKLFAWYRDVLGFSVTRLFEDGFHYCNLESPSGIRIGIADALRGRTIDVIIVPEEDAAPLVGSRTVARGDLTFRGHSMVGDVLDMIAIKGNFSFNAIVVKPPVAGDAYDGNWLPVQWTKASGTPCQNIRYSSSAHPNGCPEACADPTVLHDRAAST